MSRSVFGWRAFWFAVLVAAAAFGIAFFLGDVFDRETDD